MIVFGQAAPLDPGAEVVGQFTEAMAPLLEMARDLAPYAIGAGLVMLAIRLVTEAVGRGKVPGASAGDPKALRRAYARSERAHMEVRQAARGYRTTSLIYKYGGERGARYAARHRERVEAAADRAAEARAAYIRTARRNGF